MCPLIIIKVIINIWRLASFFNKFFLTFFWLLTSPFYLLFGIVKDMFYLIKILCDYQEEEDSFKQKEEDDFK